MVVVVVVASTVAGAVTVVDGLPPGEAEGDEAPWLQAVTITSTSPAIRGRRIDSTVRVGGE